MYLRELPLYQTLYNRIVAKGQLTAPNPTKLTEALSGISLEQAKEVTLLIIHYHFLLDSSDNPFVSENTSGRKTKLPFGIKVSTGGRGFSLDLKQLPDGLLLLLDEYCAHSIK